MKLGHIELFCGDVKRTAKFYVKVLGFDLIQEQGDLVWVGLGNVEFLLRPGKDSMVPYYQSAATALVMYTDDLESSRKLFEDRGLVFQGIDGSEKCLTFTDPSGHWWQLVNPVDH